MSLFKTLLIVTGVAVVLGSAYLVTRSRRHTDEIIQMALAQPTIEIPVTTTNVVPGTSK